MDKKTKELLRKRKRVRPASSSDSSSSSDSDSGSSSDSYSSSSSTDKKSRHHRSRRGRPRHSSSSSDDEKARKREKHACHRKAEAKRSHMKRKQKEAKAKKRVLSPASLEKKHHHHQLLKERHQMREREKLRLAHSSARMSPSSKSKIERHHHHQLSPREKIIIRRERSPPLQQISPQRGPKDIRHRLEDRRSERERIEAARQKEREDALARCQERQRERERVAKDKLRRERQDKEYDPREQRLLPRPSEREMAIAAARGQGSRDRSIEPHPEMRRPEHIHSGHRSHPYERGSSDYDREYELRHPGEHEREIDREYMMMRRRGTPSPSAHYKERVRGSERELYAEEERYERDPYQQPRSSRSSTYIDEMSHRRDRESEDWDHETRREGHEIREHHVRSEKHLYEKHREAQSPHWEDPNWKYQQQQQHIRVPGSRKKVPHQVQEENWDDEVEYRPPTKKPTQAEWVESGPPPHHLVPQSGRMKMEHGPPMKMVEGKHPHEGPPPVHGHPGVHIPQHPPTHPGAHSGPHVGPPAPHPPHAKRWPQQEWRPRAPPPHGAELRPMHPGGPPVPRVPGYRPPMHRHPGGMPYVGQERPHYPPRHPPPHMQPQHHMGGPYHPRPHFPPKRQMVYTNPNLIVSQKVAAAVVAISPNPNKPNSALVAVKQAVVSPTLLSPLSKNLGKRMDEQKDLIETGKNTPSGNSDAAGDEIEPGEIKSSHENEGLEPNEDASLDGAIQIADGETRDDLSEISDDAADDILKEEKNKTAKLKYGIGKNIRNVDGEQNEEQTENEDLLDFEEISDGELEEETRKNLGDALGVDWASLVKESEKVKGNFKDQNTTAKQKWQPHRVLLDIGISKKYAGKDFAENMLKKAQIMLDAENKIKINQKNNENYEEYGLNLKIKVEEIESLNIKMEIDEKLPDNDGCKMESETDDKVEKHDVDSENNKYDIKLSKEENVDVKDESIDIPIENLSDLACVQVAQRKNKEIQNNLVFNACGSNSKALSARKDLRLRRQLCGLPVKELECGRVVSDQMKNLAIKVFQKAIGEVK